MTTPASTKQRIQVPDSLRDILLEFSISYLLEQPGDVVDYAVEFFTKLQDSRRSVVIGSDEPPSPDESVLSTDEGEFECRSYNEREIVDQGIDTGAVFRCVINWEFRMPAGLIWIYDRQHCARSYVRVLVRRGMMQS